MITLWQKSYTHHTDLFVTCQHTETVSEVHQWSSYPDLNWALICVCHKACWGHKVFFSWRPILNWSNPPTDCFTTRSLINSVCLVALWQVGMSHVWPFTQTPTSASWHFHALGSKSYCVICINRLTYRQRQLSIASILNPCVFLLDVKCYLRHLDGKQRALAKWCYLISRDENALVDFTSCTLQ